MELADPSHRNSFILWHVLEIVDLIMVVCLGTTARFLTRTVLRWWP